MPNNSYPTRIDPDQFWDWRCNTKILYAAQTLTDCCRREKQTLSFHLYMSGCFVVSLGDKCLYHGDVFEAAKKAYDNARVEVTP